MTYTSPTCNGGSVTGVGHSVVERVCTGRPRPSSPSISGYAAARNGAIASAKDLYGRNSAECAAVLNGFNAIAVPAGTQTCSS
ncbi:MAG TPA: M4 family metallopeptidase [Ornithinibacter sp.]|nr:M4 family metallopeptidase [Ornithinibacter sp.]